MSNNSSFFPSSENRLVQSLKIGKDKLSIDNLDIGDWVDFAVCVHNVRIIKDPHYLANRTAID